MEYLLVFVSGLAGSFHCIGMCGAFPVVLSSKSRSLDQRYTNFLYNLGRIITYTILGGLFGFFGYVVGEINLVISGQIIVSIVAGIFMILVGFQILGLLKETALPGLGPLYRRVAGVMKGFLRENNYKSAFSLGIFNGFLPCPLVYAFLFTSVSKASLWQGAVIMFLMGAGTIPAMFLLGIVSSLSPSLRGNIGRYVPALVVIIFGVITVARAFLPLFSEGTNHMHHLSP